MSVRPSPLYRTRVELANTGYFSIMGLEVPWNLTNCIGVRGPLSNLSNRSQVRKHRIYYYYVDRATLELDPLHQCLSASLSFFKLELRWYAQDTLAPLSLGNHGVWSASSVPVACSQFYQSRVEFVNTGYIPTMRLELPRSLTNSVCVRVCSCGPLNYYLSLNSCFFVTRPAREIVETSPLVLSLRVETIDCYFIGSLCSSVFAI